mmetsp:Transcript_58481/g.69804  ORF Transcript_58481/g.69804 Transcript_58481/m.69804 type:complete len:102 (-) Transcript_58481:710-1015(-)
MMARSALKIRNRARAQNINTPSQNEVCEKNFTDKMQTIYDMIARFGHPQNLKINIYLNLPRSAIRRTVTACGVLSVQIYYTGGQPQFGTVYWKDLVDPLAF